MKKKIIRYGGIETIPEFFQVRWILRGAFIPAMAQVGCGTKEKMGICKRTFGWQGTWTGL